MPNRYHSPFTSLKITGSTPPKTGARGPRATLPQESAKGRPTSKGNAKSNRGGGTKLVKTFVAGEYMTGNPGNLLYGDPGPGVGGGPRFGGGPLPPVVVGDPRAELLPTGRATMPVRRAQMTADRAARQQAMLTRRRSMI